MKAVIKFDKHGNVKKIKGDIGRTRMNRAAWELWRGNVQPTFKTKLKRFFRRLKAEMIYKSDVVCTWVVGSQAAAELPYIGLIEND